MTEPNQTPDDEFAAAFSELSAPGSASSTPTAAAAAPATPSEVSPSAEGVAAGAERPAAAVPPAEPGNVSGTSAPATPAAGVEAGTHTAAQPAATPSAEAAPDYAAQIAALNAKIGELEKPQPAAEQPRPAAQPQPIYDADEQTAVDSYLKEWPDVAKGEALMRRAEYHQMMQYIWTQFGPRLDALESSTQNVTTRTQYQDIKELVPDYDNVRDATLAWIDTQPAYLKAAYQQVASQGTPKDVADLITRFRKESGYVAPASAAPGAAPVAAAAASAPAAPVAAAGLAPAAAAAAAALKPVKTARSEPVSAPDPNDFDAAFKEFSSAT